MPVTELASLGCELVYGNYDDAESMVRAFDGAWGVFAVTNCASLIIFCSAILLPCFCSSLHPILSQSSFLPVLFLILAYSVPLIFLHNLRNNCRLGTPERGARDRAGQDAGRRRAHGGRAAFHLVVSVFILDKFYLAFSFLHLLVFFFIVDEVERVFGRSNKSAQGALPI